MVLKDEKEEGEVLEFYKVCPSFYIVSSPKWAVEKGFKKEEQKLGIQTRQQDLYY